MHLIQFKLNNKCKKDNKKHSLIISTTRKEKKEEERERVRHRWTCNRVTFHFFFCRVKLLDSKIDSDIPVAWLNQVTHQFLQWPSEGSNKSKLPFTYKWKYGSYVTASDHEQKVALRNKHYAKWQFCWSIQTGNGSTGFQHWVQESKMCLFSAKMLSNNDSHASSSKSKTCNMMMFHN